MAPRAPKTAAAAASDYKFPSIADLIEDATEQVKDLPPYQLPLSAKHVIEIPRPDAETYLGVLAAQRRGAEDLMLKLLIPNPGDHAAVMVKMKGAPMQLPDRIIGNVLSYFYGTGLVVEARSDEGNSPAS